MKEKLTYISKWDDFKIGDAMTGVLNGLMKIKEKIKWEKIQILDEEKKSFGDSLSLILLRRYLNKNCIYCGTSKDLSFDIRDSICECYTCQNK